METTTPVPNMFPASLCSEPTAAEHLVPCLTRRMRLHGNQRAWNPSIIHYRGELLMSYNYEPTHEKFPNRWAWGIRMARLSEDFKVVEDRSINLNSLMAINEDMRLFIYKDRLCGVYFEGMTRGKGAGLIVVTFDEHFNIEDVFRPSFVRARNVERNWQFFGDGSDLLCAYSIQPQVILRCSPTNIVPHAKMRWRGGGYRAMCGGTPPIEFEGDRPFILSLVVPLAGARRKELEIPGSSIAVLFPLSDWMADARRRHMATPRVQRRSLYL